MKAKFIRKLSENTSLFRCDPVMRFLKPSTGPVLKHEVVESALVVAWSGEVAEGLHRAVLHNAHLLAGDEGFGYGADGCRIFDAKLNQEEVLKIAGYEIDWGNGCIQRECMNPTTGCPKGVCKADAYRKKADSDIGCTIVYSNL
jgi:hypothetical protein